MSNINTVMEEKYPWLRPDSQSESARTTGCNAAHLSVEEIAEEFGDCDWMRAVFNTWTVDAILTLIAEAKRLTVENKILEEELSRRTKPYVGVEKYYED